MASTTCGNCGRLAHMPAVSGLHQIRSPHGTGYILQAAFKCPNCLRLSLATERKLNATRDDQVYPDPGVADRAEWTAPTWLPRHLEEREFEDVPRHIASAASEATLCLSVNAYRAVGALARAVIEATAKDKGAKGNDLAQKIDALRRADHIRTHTQQQAHEVRQFGNEMAHGDFVEPVTKEEAEEVLQLMVEVLDEVYQSPARLEKRKGARVAKKADSAYHASPTSGTP